ncbi:hypothetical protein XENTR_v10015897 [Xenopus tropicalis]|nr:hypothetical protein XENTR_v10015897 [Xenopus tropicalis]
MHNGKSLAHKALNLTSVTQSISRNSNWGKPKLKDKGEAACRPTDVVELQFPAPPENTLQHSVGRINWNCTTAITKI